MNAKINCQVKLQDTIQHASEAQFLRDFHYQVSFVTRIVMVPYTRGMKWLCDNPQSHWATGIESGSVVCMRVFVWAFISSWSFRMAHYHSQDATKRDTDGAQGINDDLIEHHLDEFTRPENTCKQWFTLIKKLWRKGEENSKVAQIPSQHLKPKNSLNERISWDYYHK